MFSNEISVGQKLTQSMSKLINTCNVLISAVFFLLPKKTPAIFVTASRMCCYREERLCEVAVHLIPAGQK